MLSYLLIDNAEHYDGTTVVYQGEVVGDVMVRGDHAWVNIKDEAIALGIWCKATDIRDLNYRGSYKYGGDIVQIKGIFHRSCAEHGGDLDIHAEEVIKLYEGHALMHPVSEDKIRATLILSAGMTCLFALYLVKKRKFRSL